MSPDTWDEIPDRPETLADGITAAQQKLVCCDWRSRLQYTLSFTTLGDALYL